MSDTTETETDTNTNTDEPSKAELHERVQQLESTVQRMMPSRRDALRMGAAGLAGAAGLGAASQSADAATGSAGTIGSTSNRPDLVSDEIDTNRIESETLLSFERTVLANSTKQLDPNRQQAQGIYLMIGSGFPGRSGIFSVGGSGTVSDFGTKNMGTSSGASQVNIFDDNGTTVIENTRPFNLTFAVARIA